jgi:D-alanine-D-alanine ligase
VRAAALGAYRALRVRDYGRIDLRLSEDGRPYVIEANASCYLERESEFSMGATAEGIPHAALVNRIADLAVERFRRAAAVTGARRRPKAAAPERVP